MARRLITALESLTIAYEVIDVAGVIMPTGEPIADKADCYDFIQAHYADGSDDGAICEMIGALPRAEQEAPYLADLDQQVLELQQAIKELSDFDEMRLHLLLPQVAKRYGITKDKLLTWVYEYKQGDFISEPIPHHESISHDEFISPFMS